MINSKVMSAVAMIALLVPSVTLAKTTEPMTTEVSDRLYVETGGYTQVKIDTNMEQKYPLLQVNSLELPMSVKYIGQSINYMLSLSGYKLEPLEYADKDVLHLYSLKLPMSNRTFKKSTTLQVVETIVGVGYEVVVDEVERTVAIKVRKNEVGK